MAGIWQRDSWLRLSVLVLGAAVFVSCLGHTNRLPWTEIVFFSLIATLLRQRQVPLIKDSKGNVILAHVPGESVLLLLILRHGAEAAVCTSFLTNLLASVLGWKQFYSKPSYYIGSTSNIFLLPLLTFVWAWVYQALGGVRLRTPEDCTLLFQDPERVALPFLGASLVTAELLNRCFQSMVAWLRHGTPLRQSLGDFSLGTFEHLENIGAVLALACWTTWGWGVLPFILVLMESLLVSAREKVHRIEARKAASLDVLTGLASARGLSEGLAQRLRPNTPPFALLYLDMDRFKQVNDTYGHGVGDELLIQVARALQKNVVPEALVARRGGDEFILLLPLQDRAEAERARTCLREAVESAIADDPRFRWVSFSAGVALFPSDGTSEEALLDAADRAMYAEKQARQRLAA